MKKRMIIALAALLIFGLSIATFAYKQTTSTSNTAISSPCCNSDSCPMKTKDEKAGTISADMQGVTVATSSTSCDCPYCKHKKTTDQ